MSDLLVYEALLNREYSMKDIYNELGYGKFYKVIWVAIIGNL